MRVPTQTVATESLLRHTYPLPPTRHPPSPSDLLPKESGAGKRCLHTPEKAGTYQERSFISVGTKPLAPPTACSIKTAISLTVHNQSKYYSD